MSATQRGVWCTARRRRSGGLEFAQAAMRGVGSVRASPNSSKGSRGASAAQRSGADLPVPRGSMSTMSRLRRTPLSMPAKRCERGGGLAGSAREHEQRIGLGAQRVRGQHRDRDGDLSAAWRRAIFRHLDAGAARGGRELRQAAIGELDARVSRSGRRTRRARRRTRVQAAHRACKIRRNVAEAVRACVDGSRPTAGAWAPALDTDCLDVPRWTRRVADSYTAASHRIGMTCRTTASSPASSRIFAIG